MTTSEPTLQDLKLKPLRNQRSAETRRSYKPCYLLQIHWSQALWKTLVRGPLGVNNLLREWNKLELDEHGILRRKSSSSLQLVLPKQFVQYHLPSFSVRGNARGLVMAKERKRRPPLTFTYSQMGVLEYQRIHPVAHSAQTPMVIPDQALAGWLVANSGLCVRQYPTQMLSLHFQQPVPQPAWVPW